MRILDARARPPIPAFLGDRTYVNLERTLGNVRARGWEPTASMLAPDMEGFLAELAAAGIERAGVPARVPNRWWGGKGNDPVFADCAAHPETLFVYAAVDPSDPDAPGQAEALKARGALGIVLEPGICDEPAYLDDERFDALYDALAQLGLPALLMGGGEAGPDLSFIDPVRFERVAIRHPELQLVNVHGGWPLVQGALGVAFRRANVWMMADVYFPNLPGEADYVLAMRTFLRDRFLFSTGYPFCPIGATLERYRSLGLPDDVLEGVLGGNAARLLGV